MNLTLAGAFLGGVLTLLSPCSVMLLPAFFAYAFTSAGALAARTGMFFLGLVTALVPLGLLAGSLGAWVGRHRFELVSVGAWVVIVLGVALAAGVRMPGPVRQRGASGVTNGAVFALGTVYGLAGVCAGPMLGAALSYAAFGGNALAGGIVLLVFAAGMTLPLFLLGLLWSRVPGVRALVRPREVRIGGWRNTWGQLIGGLLTVAIGVLLLVTKGTTTLGGMVGASTQLRIESSVLAWTSGVPNWVPLTIGAVLIAVWVATRIVSSRRLDRAELAAARNAREVGGEDR